MIILEAGAGLGNRMYSIASAYHLAQLASQRLLVLWKIDHTLGAQADAVFRFPKEIEIVPIYEGSFKQAPFKRLKSLRIKNSYKTAATTVLTSMSVRMLMKHADGYSYLKELAAQPELLYIESYICFLPNVEDQSVFYQIFTPSERVMQKAHPLLAQIRPDTIGLHIRRTDHAAAIQHSPLSAFTARMDFCLRENPSATFFVATDDSEVERQLLSSYPHSVIVNSSKHFTRTSTDGIADACVDIFCLSRCAKIIGSYGSSFSHVASMLQNTPLEIVDIQSAASFLNLQKNIFP